MPSTDKVHPLVLERLEKSKRSILIVLIPQRHIPIFDVNLAVHFSKDKALRGIYLSIDRPTELLKKTMIRFGATMDNLLLMDAARYLTGWRDKEGSADRWLHALSDGDNLRWLISILDDGTHHEGAKAMVIIDNLGTLSCYASENVILYFLDQCRNIGGVKTLAIFDPASNAQLLQTLKRTEIGEMLDLTQMDL